MAEQNGSDEALGAMWTPDAATFRRARRRVTAACRAEKKALERAFEEALDQWCEDQIPDDPSMQEDWYARYGGLDEEELAELEAEEQEAWWRMSENEPDDRDFDPDRDLPPGVHEKLRAKAASSPTVERAAQRVARARLHLETLHAFERLRIFFGL